MGHGPHENCAHCEVGGDGCRRRHQGCSGILQREKTGRDDANSSKTKGYNLLNTLAGLDINISRFSMLISAGINNIFDEVYVGFVNTNSVEKRYYEPGEPFSLHAQINLGYRF